MARTVRRSSRTHRSKVSERKSTFTTISFRPVPATATQAMVRKSGGAARELPGQFPYTRGIHETMYRGRLWTMRQFAGFGSPEETNARFRYLLAQGQTGLSTAFDMPSLMGYDADHPRSKGEVGREGVSISTIEDMERLFHGIALDQVTVSMTINSTAPVVMAMYLALARRRGIPWDRLGGTIQNDMLKEFIAQKEWISPPDPSLRLSCDIIEFCAEHVPRFNPVSLSGYHIREAGATALQELAFTIADGVAYVEHCLGRGMPIDSFAPRLSFFFDIHNDFLEEIAKLRAARRIWARLMKTRFGARDPRSQMLRTHAQTAGVSLTAQQPMNNVARVAVQALAAVLGGVQSLHTNSMDETLALPTEESATVALRTQQILAEETGVANIADPLGGSYYLEDLTNWFTKETFNYLKRIDRMGGMLKAIDAGFPQTEISESAYQFQLAVDREEYRVVGVTAFAEQEAQQIPTLTIDPRSEREQRRRVQAFKAKRARKQHLAAIKRLRERCVMGGNIMAVLVEAVDGGVTLGEVAEIFRDVFGVYRDPGFI